MDHDHQFLTVRRTVREGLTGPEEAPFAGTDRQNCQNRGFFASLGSWCCFVLM
jgi:hypothetical protein